MIYCMACWEKGCSLPNASIGYSEVYIYTIESTSEVLSTKVGNKKTRLSVEVAEEMLSYIHILANDNNGFEVGR